MQNVSCDEYIRKATAHALTHGFFGQLEVLEHRHEWWTDFFYVNDITEETFNKWLLKHNVRVVYVNDQAQLEYDEIWGRLAYDEHD